MTRPASKALRIYISKNGQRYGPYSVEELRKEVHSNFFRPSDFASHDNGNTWITISQSPHIGPLAFSVQSDPANNLLEVRYFGRVVPREVEHCAREVKAALKELPLGFRLLADFTDLELMDLACAPHLEKIMEMCDEKEVTAVVRIMPDPGRDIGLQIMSYFHYRSGVRIVTCKTREEANEILTLLR